MPSAAAKHDYARVWRRLKPSELDRRITQALDRLSKGETLSQVAATWNIHATALCRALIAYAPLEWRAALTARALLRYERAAADLHRAPGNSIMRARAWASRWHLEYALKALAQCELELRGRELVGPCLECGSKRSVSVAVDGRTWCYRCEWKGERRQYVADVLARRPECFRR